MTILSSSAQEMARPYFAFVLRRQKLLEHQKARPVQADRVNAHHLDALIKKIFHRAGHEADVLVDVIVCAKQFIAAGVKQNNVHGLELVIDLLEGGNNFIFIDKIGEFQVSKVQHNAGAVT